MLRGFVRREGHPDVTDDALNDVVVTKATLSRIIELDVSVDGLFVSTFRADGLLTFDGQRGFPLRRQDSVQVTRSPRTLRLVTAAGRDYFGVLRAKLKWGESTVRDRK